MRKIDMKGTSARKSKVIEPEIVDGGTYSELAGAIGSLLEKAREKIATMANTKLVDTYWRTGRYIVEYEQRGADRAKYGSRLLSSLARDLTLAHGNGFMKAFLIIVAVILFGMAVEAMDMCPSFAPKAVQEYRRRADAGDAEAQYLYAEALRCGLGVAKDLSMSMKYAAMATKQRYGAAYLQIAEGAGALVLRKVGGRGATALPARG